MSYWLREIAGWIVLVIGLAIFVLVYDLLLRKRVIEASPLAFVGVVVFRGGIHLLKVAMAVRASREAVKAPPPARRSLTLNAPRTSPTDLRNAMPGPKSETSKSPR